MTDLSIVIVNYNVKQLLLECLHTIYKYAPAGLVTEIIVVDNNSSDQSVEAVVKAFPEVTVIANQFNAGFPAANNQAFNIANGKYILMLNPDTELIDDSLLKLYNYIHANVDIELVAPMLLNTDGSRQQSVWRYPSLRSVFYETNYLSFLLGKKNYADKNFNEIFEAESFSGAAILFRKTVFDKIGMLDETMFWIEDIDFCYRANKAGLKLVYYPEAKIKHHIGQSAKKNYNISLSNQIFNKIKFFKKHHSRLQWLLVVFISFYHVLLKLMVFGILSPFNKVYYRKAKAYLYTLPRVFNPPVGIK